MAKNIQFNVKLNVDGKDQLVTATTSVKELQKAVSSSQGAFSTTIKAVNDWGFAISNSVSSLNSVAGALNSLTTENRTFSAAMAEANTMAGKSGEGFGSMKSQVSELSKEVPIARDALAKGLYQVISNGVPEDNWISFLEKSAKASVGGLADLEEVVKVTSTVIKNYGLEWNAAGEIQDKIQLTAKNGVTSFEQLAQALPRVTANASTLGISVDELMAAFATLTGVSGNTAEVSTQLAAIMTSLIKPSSEAAKMAEAMGIQFDAAAIKAAGGMQNFLVQLDSDIKSYASSTGQLETEIYGRLFGSAEALRALTPLTGNLAEKFSENVESMKGSAGTIDEAFGTMAGTGAAALQKLKNAMGDVTDAFSASISTVQSLVNGLALIGNAALPVVTLSKLTAQAVTSQKVLTASVIRTSLAYAAFGTNTRKVAAAMNVLSASTRSAATAAVAMKVALRGLLVASGVGIAIAAVSAAVEVLANKLDTGSSAVSSMTDAQRKSQAEAARQAAVQKRLGDSAGELVGKFQTLQAQWKSLKTEGEKTAFIKQNQSAFADLGLHIDDVNSAYNTFVSNAPKVVAALTAIAKADAWKDIYKDSIKDKASNFDRKFKYVKAKAGDKVQVDAATGEMSAEMKAAGVKGTGSGRIVGGVMAQRDYGILSAEDAKRLNNYRYQQGAQRKRTEEQGYDANINDALRNLTSSLTEAASARNALGSAGMKAFPATSAGGSGKGGHTSASTTKTEAPAPKGSLKELNDQATAIRAQIDLEIDPEKQKELVQQYNDIKAQIETEEIACGLTMPKEAEVKSQLDKLKEQLDAAQKEFDNAVTVEAKVEAACNVAKIQGEINTATNGQLTIPAEVESTYVEIGSIKDKRQSYQNAQSKASQVQSDFDAGLINKDEAEEQIAEINEELSKLGEGVKPIELEIEARGFKKTFSSIKDGFDSVQNVGRGIEDITDSIENSDNAWDAITGIMSGFFETAEGIKGVAELVKSFTGTTTAATAAKSAEAVATTSDAVAKQVDTDVTIANTAASEANAVAKSGEAIAGATSSGASMPFPMNIVAIAMGVAAVVAALATCFATGGVVGGGSTFGDKKFARVNSGEMILNKFQQANLFNLINSGLALQTPQVSMPKLQPVSLNTSALASSLYSPSDMMSNVNFKISGRDLVGSVANTTRLAAKSGKKSNIKI